jgi:hypothetical protein
MEFTIKAEHGLIAFEIFFLEIRFLILGAPIQIKIPGGILRNLRGIIPMQILIINEAK